MAKLLYITANPKAENESFGLTVGRAFLNAYKKANPQDQIIELDLFKENIPEIDEDVFSGWGKLSQGTAFDQLSAQEKAKVGRINELTDLFVSADRYVFVTPMWNFSFPARVKMFIDTICVAGKTFKYTEMGPVGLLGGKRTLHIQARGGYYSEGVAKEVELGDRYLRVVMQFIGITDVQSIYVEGMAAQPEKADEIKTKAIQQAEKVAQTFGQK